MGWVDEAGADSASAEALHRVFCRPASRWRTLPSRRSTTAALRTACSTCWPTRCSPLHAAWAGAPNPVFVEAVHTATLQYMPDDRGEYLLRTYIQPNRTQALLWPALCTTINRSDEVLALRSCPGALCLPPVHSVP